MRAKMYFLKIFPTLFYSQNMYVLYKFYQLAGIDNCAHSFTWLCASFQIKEGKTTPHPHHKGSKRSLPLSIRLFVYFFHIWYEFVITTI